MSFEVANQTIGERKIFVIAEIGQNHQGSIEIAKQMIVEAKRAGADCVKFQKSCLIEKFTANALHRSYDGPNSWGKTYGDHKQYLEFNIEQYKLLQNFAQQQNILFTASAMDIKSLHDLNELNVPVIKIGSGDANNIPLLMNAAKLQTPLIVSTGMQSETMIRRIVTIMEENNKTNYCLLHCVSAYPTAPQHVHLKLLSMYRSYFPNTCLGYSGHERGTAISTAAVVLGAKVIERHFTLDKRQKGTDHGLSLEAAELKQLIARIRMIENILPAHIDDDQTVFDFLSPFLTDNERSDVRFAMASIQQKRIEECEIPCRLKLGKSLVYRSNMTVGGKLRDDDICAKVNEPFGISAEHFDSFIGKILRENVLADENLTECHFEN